MTKKIRVDLFCQILMRLLISKFYAIVISIYNQTKVNRAVRDFILAVKKKFIN